jgi:cell wall-associated NlpC family hydrolase
MDDKERAARDAIDRIADEWIGTPFHDNAELKGIGVDCARLLKCVFTEAGQIDDFALPHYSAQHFLHQTEEKFLGWVQKFAREIALADVQYGDIVLYKVGHVYSHGAIVVEPGLPHIVHAWFRSRRVRRALYLEGDLGVPKLQPRFFTRW